MLIYKINCENLIFKMLLKIVVKKLIIKFLIKIIFFNCFGFIFWIIKVLNFFFWDWIKIFIEYKMNKKEKL